MGWFGKQIRANIEAALQHHCVIIHESKDHDSSKKAVHHLYSQSQKHKGYNPRCFFDAKSEVTQVAHICPQTASDLIEILGLKREEDLPDFLQGWKRDCGWTSSESYSSTRPFGGTGYWCFGKRVARGGSKCRELEATVCLGLAKAICTELVVK